MAVQLARSAGASKCVVITLTLLLSVLRLMQCRHVANLSAPEVAGVRLPHKRPVGFRVDLVHRDSPLSPLYAGNITSPERLKRAIQRSRARQQKLLKSVRDEKILADSAVGEYFLSAAIGTPSIPFLAILDTSSDLIWTQCQPCSDCYDQPDPIYDPSSSSTYGRVPCPSPICQNLQSYCASPEHCHYLNLYPDLSSTEGILPYETLALSSQLLTRIVFGCSNFTRGSHLKSADGFIGFGRGPLSLISQLGRSGGNKFSYCLVSLNNSAKTSPLFIGNSASLESRKFGSTRLIQISAKPSLYYILLKGISVGGKWLDIPDGTFDPTPDGTSGLIIDSAISFTLLKDVAYEAVSNALISAISLPKTGSPLGLDLCLKLPFSSSTVNDPALTFHFDGADWDLPTENYLVADGSGAICLAMQSDEALSVIGSIQQQNLHILYDNEKHLLSFAPTVCDRL